MREKFKLSGRMIEKFPDHEKMEMLLFNCIRRGNTNETGHLLMNSFGSVSGVFKADPKELTKVDGVGKQSAFFLKLCGGLMDYLYDDSKLNAEFKNKE